MKLHFINSFTTWKQNFQVQSSHVQTSNATFSTLAEANYLKGINWCKSSFSQNLKILVARINKFRISFILALIYSLIKLGHF